MNSRICLFALVMGLSVACKSEKASEPVTTGSLLAEMTDLNRLPRISDQPYKTVQYSSYDRRSKAPGLEGWFDNEDGFGGEPIPGFQQVLKEPDAGGTGEYLICDVNGPGAIVRLWTAGIKGRVRLYLDNFQVPYYEGDAEDFFWKTPEVLWSETIPASTFRQFDAVYFPIPFSRQCRLEWIGNIKDLHFYHVGMRIYEHYTNVKTFSKEDALTFAGNLDAVSKIFAGTGFDQTMEMSPVSVKEAELAPQSTRVLWQEEGAKAIEYFSVRVQSENLETDLRKCILSIYFDGSSIPQVQAPLGDFFGAAPGINPYHSLPFSVDKTGDMVCRFIMPFREHARIEVSNQSLESVHLFTGIRISDYRWEVGKTMYFHARWKIDHEMVASDTMVRDMPYLLARGRGRIVGAASYLYNPSPVPTSWGNWWGEGDEKIYSGSDTFPSIFGTGSEDYYNYSWSSARIFSCPYCGQPRNDGPGNRGYVSNFRWHILDDIPFSGKLEFYMELRSHGSVPRFAYGRIVYFYALPGITDDFQQVSKDDTRDLPYYPWKPEAYLGSAGYLFMSAEDLVEKNNSYSIEEGKFWAEGRILMWKPLKTGDRIKFIVDCARDFPETHIGFTLSKMPGGGSISVSINGEPVKLNGNDILQLTEQDQTVLDNFFTGPVHLKKGKNEIVVKSMDEGPGKKNGIDFIWIRNN